MFYDWDISGKIPDKQVETLKRYVQTDWNWPCSFRIYLFFRYGPLRPWGRVMFCSWLKPISNFLSWWVKSLVWTVINNGLVFVVEQILDVHDSKLIRMRNTVPQAHWWYNTCPLFPRHFDYLVVCRQCIVWRAQESNMPMFTLYTYF